MEPGLCPSATSLKVIPRVVIPASGGNVLHKPLDSSAFVPDAALPPASMQAGLRRAATGILPSRRIQDFLSINDGGVIDACRHRPPGFPGGPFPTCLRQAGAALPRLGLR